MSMTCPESRLVSKAKQAGVEFRIDKLHRCSSRCPLERDGDVYLCLYSGCVHRCGSACEHATVSSDGMLVCSLTATEIGPMMCDALASKETYLRAENNFVHKSALKTKFGGKHAESSTERKYHSAYSEARAAALALLKYRLIGEENSAKTKQASVAAVRMAMRGVRLESGKGRRPCLLRAYEVVRREMRKRVPHEANQDGTVTNETLADRIGHSAARALRICERATEAAKLRQQKRGTACPARLRRTPPPAKNLALAIAYAMRDGGIVHAGRNVLPREPVLGDRLPEHAALAAAGFCMNSLTKADVYLREALETLIDFGHTVDI